MKKIILMSLGTFYAGISLGYANYDPPKFSTVNWSTVVPVYVSYDINVLQCGMKAPYYTCWIIPSDIIKDPLPYAHVAFKLASDQTKYCEYEVIASWDSKKCKYNFDTEFLNETSGIKCQTYNTDGTWLINQ